MGKSNRTAALESKIAFLRGEHEETREAIAKAVELIDALPDMRARLSEIDTLVQACEAVVKSDHPEWTSDHIEPKRRYTHKSPVRLGMGVKQALSVMLEFGRAMTVKEIAIEVLKREGHEQPDDDTITKLSNSIGNQFRKGNRSHYVAHDGAWPARWWVINPS